MMPQREQQFLDNLVASFESAGWRVSKCKKVGDVRADLEAKKGRLHYIVEIKAAADARREVLEGFMADAFLRARLGPGHSRGRALAVMAAPRLSDAMAAALAEYARRFGEGAPFGLMDLAGRLELKGPGLSDVQLPVAKGRASSRAQKGPDIFSDRNQWLLKVLLAPTLKEGMLRSPRQPVANASQLAGAAGVSLPSAFRLLEALRTEQFLEEEGGRLRLVRVEALLDRWRSSYLRPVTELPCRWLLGGDDLDRAVQRYVAKGTRACLGLFTACERLGLRHVHGVPDHILVEDRPEQALADLGLVPAAGGERPDVIVRRPRWREAVFRGCVSVGNKGQAVPVADVLQCWLDLAHYPARGAEQAGEIWRRILAPQLLEQR